MRDQENHLTDKERIYIKNHGSLELIEKFNYSEDQEDRFKFTPLWLITGLFILVIFICCIAIKSFEYGAEQVATGKLKCVTKDHNTMCEEVKR